jgi:hypothetical protein
MAKSAMTWTVVILLMKRIAIACALVLAATAAQAQQQASCEQNRLKCQTDWAQKNIDGVPVTPPDKTKLCWDGFYACTGAARASQGPAPTAKPDAARTTAALPPMKRIAMQTRSGGDYSMIIDECRINENEVRCMGRRQQTIGQPPYHQPTSDEYTLTGQISGAVITGVLSWRHVRRYVWNGCGATGEFSAPATVTLRPNGEATLQHGSRPAHWTRTGPAICAEVVPTTVIPESQQEMSWRAID